MYTFSVRITFHIPYAESLKDKRMVSRSLLDKARRKFNASIAEVDTQDNHRVLTIGIAVVAGEASHGQDYLDKIVRFVEGNTDAVLVESVYDE